MPLRDPNEQGTRRPWSRRHGIGGFPKAGGLNKEGTAGDVLPYDFRHLENVRWNDPRLRERGGQTALLAPGQELSGCILGLVDVADATAILIANGYLSRYYTESDPDFVEDIDPIGNIPANLITLSGMPLVWASNDGKVYKINIPPVPADQIQAQTSFNELFELPEPLKSWVWKYEFVDDPESPSFEKTIPVLYMGTTLGKVYRWDGNSLALDVTLGVVPVVLTTWASDIVAAFGHNVQARNLGPWNRTIAIAAGTVAFIPTGWTGAEMAGRFFFGGSETVDPTNSGRILYYDPATDTMLTEVIEGGVDGIERTNGPVALEVFQGKLYYLYRADSDTYGGLLGRVDANLTWDHEWISTNGELGNTPVDIIGDEETLFFSGMYEISGTQPAGLFSIDTTGAGGSSAITQLISAVDFGDSLGVMALV